VRPHQPGQAAFRAILSEDIDWKPFAAFPAEARLALYRTAQEALTNTAKYAGRGARAELRLTYGDAEVELGVEDVRAAGAPPAPAGLTFGGYGLAGMRERAELLGGSLAAGPTAGGFRVLLRLPAARPAEQSAEQPANRADGPPAAEARRP